MEREYPETNCTDDKTFHFAMTFLEMEENSRFMVCYRAPSCRVLEHNNRRGGGDPREVRSGVETALRGLAGN